MQRIFAWTWSSLIGLLATASIPAITLGLIYKKFKTEKAKPGNENLTFKEFIKKSAACKKALITAGVVTPVFGAVAVPLFAIIGCIATMYSFSLFSILSKVFRSNKEE